jgi:hypothetical protein
MQNPDCGARYQRHRTAGGTLSYPQFAYRYAATGGFTAHGMAQYRATEAQNQAREAAAAAGLRHAEAQRGAAQGQHAGRYAWSQQELGNHLQGRSTWADPRTGEHHVLQYTRPNVSSYDPRTGQRYAMDSQGRYYAQTPSGYWYPMTPAR